MITCKECKYSGNCPCGYSLNNAACLAIQKPKDKNETNYEHLRTLSKEEFAHLFVKLRLDAAEESDWLEWLDNLASKDEWEQILK